MALALTGRIVKGIGGFYYVDTPAGVFECRARGRFRHEGITPLVGDIVRIEENYVIDILPRKNFLTRPRVANIDKALVTFAASRPKPNIDILNRFLVLAAAAGVEAVICINKVELARRGELDELRETYKNSGFDFLEASCEERIGLKRIEEKLSGCASVLAGPSGVGKSSIINLITSNNLKTGEVSKNTRGRHTTREAVLISLEGGGYIVDTPGFTSLSLLHLESEKLCNYFPEFLPHLDDCRFPACSHVNEPKEECGVKMGVGKDIHEKRYEFYVKAYNELREQEVGRYG